METRRAQLPQQHGDVSRCIVDQLTAWHVRAALRYERPGHDSSQLVLTQRRETTGTNLYTWALMTWAPGCARELIFSNKT